MNLTNLKQKIGQNLKSLSEDWQAFTVFVGISTFITLVSRGGGVSNLYNISRALNSSSSVINLTEKVIKVSLPLAIIYATHLAGGCYLHYRGKKLDKAAAAAVAAWAFTYSMLGSSAAAFGGVVGAAAMSTIAAGSLAVPVAGIVGAFTTSYLSFKAYLSLKESFSTATALASRNTISNLHHITNVLSSSSSISLSVMANLTKTVLKVSLPFAIAQAVLEVEASYMCKSDVKEAEGSFATSMMQSSAAALGGVVGAAAMSTIAAGFAVPVAGVVGAFTAAHLGNMAAKALEPKVNAVIGKFTNLVSNSSNIPQPTRR